MENNQDLSFDIILGIIKKCHGYDFSSYSRGLILRRLVFHQKKQGLKTLADIIPLLLNYSNYYYQCLPYLALGVTEFFKDPGFYSSFAKLIIPKLKTYSYIKIWHAGSSTGEEVYSMAILLDEHNFLNRALLYGTDFNPTSLEIAKIGAYSSKKLKIRTDKSKKIILPEKFNSYVIKDGDSITFKETLKKNITFSLHNLVTDFSFGEMEVIICRNVLIYFEDDLKKRVIELFKQSLPDYGFLCLGKNESVDDDCFKCIDDKQAIYQKKTVPSQLLWSEFHFY